MHMQIQEHLCRITQGLHLSVPFSERSHPCYCSPEIRLAGDKAGPLHPYSSPCIIEVNCNKITGMLKDFWPINQVGVCCFEHQPSS